MKIKQPTKSLYPKDVLFLLTFLIVFASCSLVDHKKDCPAIKITTDSLKEADKTSIPYAGYDSIKFKLLPMGTYHTFYGQGRINDFTKKTYNYDPDCPDNIANCEYESFLFKSSTAPNDPIYLLLDVEGHGQGTATSLKFRNKSFLFSPYNVNGPGGIGSAVIQGVTYNDVYFIYDSSKRGDTSAYLLYNKSDGIIKLKITNYEIWEKIK